MQIEDLLIAIGTATEMLVEGVAPDETPTDAQIFHAVSAGLRALAERLERDRAATVGELQAQVQAMQERMDALERQAAAEKEEITRLHGELTRRVVDIVVRLVGSGMKPAAVLRWLTGAGWRRKSQRSALLLEAAAELAACEPQALWGVVTVITGDKIWRDLIDRLADVQSTRRGEDADAEVVDLDGARRRATIIRG